MAVTARWCAFAAAALALAGCTTVATGVLADPQGVNPHSYRWCLARNGFLTDHALVGMAGQDYARRHAADRPRAASPVDLTRVDDARFVALTARIIRDGLFPHLQYGGDLVATPAAAPGAYVAEAVRSRPYMVNEEGASYDKDRSTLVPPPVGTPSRPDLPVNRFLDCYLAPVGLDEGEFSATGDYDLEGRLLRAHVLLAMLTAYGAELVTSRASSRQPEEAARLLGHVRDAELSLRAASVVMNPNLRQWAFNARRLRTIAPAKPAGAKNGAGKKDRPPTPAESAAPKDGAAADPVADAVAIDVPLDRAGATPLLRWQSYATRLLRVFQIGVDITVIDAHRSLDAITNVIAASEHPNPAALNAVVKEAVAGMATVQKVQIYGDAMRRDAAETLAEHRLALTTAPAILVGSATLPAWRIDVPAETLRWQVWDARLDGECRLLASVAKQTAAGCIPKADALKEALAAEVPGAAQ